MKIYVVRHGETIWNAESRVQGVKDIDLNDNGRAEAYELQGLVKELDIDVVLSSPLRRAKETAEILVNDALPVTVDSRLIERFWGQNEGKLLGDIDTHTCWDVNLNIDTNDIEKIQDFMQRIADFIEEIKVHYYGRKVLIVTHSAVVRVIHYLLGRIPEDGDLSRINIPNLRILEYELYERGN